MILKAYLKKRLKLLALLCAFALIFALVLWASALPAGAVGYAALLCAAPGPAGGDAGFFRFCRAHRALSDMRGRVSVSLDGCPRPGILSRPIGGPWSWRRTMPAGLRRKGLRPSCERRTTTIPCGPTRSRPPLPALELLLQDPQGPPRPGPGGGAGQGGAVRGHGPELHAPGGGEAATWSSAAAPWPPSSRPRCAGTPRLFILKGIRLELSSLEGEALTDGKWLGFALEQLISNAVKYTPSGGHVRIWVQEGPAVLVEDDGPRHSGPGSAPGVRPGLYRPGRPHRRPFHRHRPVPYPQGPECPGPCRIPFLPARPGRLRQDRPVGQAPGPD